MADLRVALAGLEHHRRGTVAEVHREAAGVGVGVAQRQRPHESRALGRIGVGAGLEAGGVVHRVHGDLRFDHLVGEADAVRAGPQEVVRPEEVLVAQIDQIAREQLGDGHLLARRHRRPGERQHATVGQRIDADRLQRLAVGIDEAGLEHRRVEHDRRVLVARGRDRRHRRPLVGVDLVEHAFSRAVARRAGGVRGPGHREAAVGQRRHPRLELAARGLGVDLELAVEPRAVRRVLLGEYAEARAVGAVVVPDDHEAAGVQRRHVRRVLRADALVVDAELLDHRRAGRVVDLGEHALARGVEAVVHPDHHQPPVGQRRHAGGELPARRHRRQSDVAALRVPGGVEAPAEHAEAAPVLAAVGLPDDEEAAVAKRRDRRNLLVA